MVEREGRGGREREIVLTGVTTLGCKCLADCIFMAGAHHRLLITVLPERHCEVTDGLRNALHRHWLVVHEPVILSLHSGPVHHRAGVGNEATHCTSYGDGPWRGRRRGRRRRKRRRKRRLTLTHKLKVIDPPLLQGVCVCLHLCSPLCTCMSVSLLSTVYMYVCISALTNVAIYFQYLLDAAGLHESGRDPLLHG